PAPPGATGTAPAGGEAAGGWALPGPGTPTLAAPAPRAPSRTTRPRTFPVTGRFSGRNMVVPPDVARSRGSGAARPGRQPGPPNTTHGPAKSIAGTDLSAAALVVAEVARLPARPNSGEFGYPRRPRTRASSATKSAATDPSRAGRRSGRRTSCRSDWW